MSFIHERLVSARDHAGKKDGQIIIKLTKLMKELTMDDHLNIQLITNEHTRDSTFYQIPVPVIREYMHNKGSDELHLNPFKSEMAGSSTYSFTENTSGKGWQKYLVPSHKMNQFDSDKKTGYASLTDLFADIPKVSDEYDSKAAKYRLDRYGNSGFLDI